MAGRTGSLRFAVSDGYCGAPRAIGCSHAQASIPVVTYDGKQTINTVVEKFGKFTYCGLWASRAGLCEIKAGWFSVFYCAHKSYYVTNDTYLKVVLASILGDIPFYIVRITHAPE